MVAPHMATSNNKVRPEALSDEALARAEAEYGIRFRVPTGRQLKAAIRKAARNIELMDKSIDRAKRVSDAALRIRFDR